MILGKTVKLRVVPVPELVEFSTRTAALQGSTSALGKVNFASSGSLRTKILTKVNKSFITILLLFRNPFIRRYKLIEI